MPLVLEKESLLIPHPVSAAGGPGGCGLPPHAGRILVQCLDIPGRRARGRDWVPGLWVDQVPSGRSAKGGGSSGEHGARRDSHAAKGRGGSEMKERGEGEGQKQPSVQSMQFVILWCTSVVYALLTLDRDGPGMVNSMNAITYITYCLKEMTWKVLCCHLCLHIEIKKKTTPASVHVHHFTLDEVHMCAAVIHRSPDGSVVCKMKGLCYCPYHFEEMLRDRFAVVDRNKQQMLS